MLALWALALAVDPPPAPVLNVDAHGISCSGISSGADFAVQFATAFSARVRGVGVFAGQPYHCAATRFPLDTTFPCNETKPGGHGPVGPEAPAQHALGHGPDDPLVVRARLVGLQDAHPCERAQARPPPRRPSASALRARR